MFLSWQSIPLLVGFILGFILYSKFQFRAGGVIILPIIAISFVKFPMYLPYVLSITLVNLIILEILYKKILIYGRRLLYLSLSIGIGLFLILSLITEFPVGTSGLLVPGLLAYNIHRERNSTVVKIKSLAINVILFMFLVLVSYISLKLFQ